MYEVLVAWETLELADEPPVIRDFAEIWRAADKIVYSKTLEAVSSARTRLERDFDPEAVRQLKASAERDLAVGGPELAGQAIRAGLVDEYQLFVAPIMVGGGTEALPANVRVELELLDERRFGNGMAYLRYRAANAAFQPRSEPHRAPCRPRRASRKQPPPPRSPREPDSQCRCAKSWVGQLESVCENPSLRSCSHQAAGAVRDRDHDRPKYVAVGSRCWPSASLRCARAWKVRLFTVPVGMPSLAAISDWVRPPQ